MTTNIAATGRPSQARAGLAGVLATGGGLAVAELIGGLLGVRQTPVFAVGAAFIDITPKWLRDFAITWFGSANKLVLSIGILTVATVGAAAVGMLAARRRWPAAAVIGVVAVLTGVVAATRPDAEWTAALPGLVGGAVAIGLLPWLLGRFGVETTASRSAGDAGEVDVSSPTDPRRAGRRDVLRIGGLTAAGAAAVGGFGRWWGDRSVIEEARTELSLPVPDSPADLKTPAGADFDVSGLASWRTSNKTFYRVDTAFPPPRLVPEDWKLRIHGMVERPITLTFDKLIRRPVLHRWVTLACVSNPVGGDLVGNALWSGVSTAELLAEVGVDPDADAVKSTSEDGWTCGTPLQALTDDRESLLAFAMNGEPLPHEHGFPVRMVVPGLYGYVSATKWVIDLEVTRFDRFKAYWSTRGWAEQAPIKVASRIDRPTDAAKVTAGKVVVAGVAWAQNRGIDAVEVRVDEESWQPAELADEPTIDSWRQWRFTWNATPGDHRIAVRATTADGELQTTEEAAPAPDGATGLHTITVTVTAS